MITKYYEIKKIPKSTGGFRRQRLKIQGNCQEAAGMFITLRSFRMTTIQISQKDLFNIHEKGIKEWFCSKTVFPQH